MVTGKITSTSIIFKWFTTHIASQLAWQRTINSASVVDNATEACFLVAHEIVACSFTTYPETERRSFGLELEIILERKKLEQCALQIKINLISHTIL